MKEKNMQTFWTKHISNVPPQGSEVWELKFTRTKSIRFDAIAVHQREALLQAKHEGIFHKITDIPVTYYGGKSRFTKPSPFDCLYLHKVPAYVVVWFYVPRQPKVFIKIDIDDFLEMERTTERKSFTEEMALQTGEPVKITK